MSGQFEIRTGNADDAAALSLLGQATFLEVFAGILNGPDILAHCAKAHAADVYRDWLVDPRYRIWLALAQPGLAPVGYAVLAPSDLPVPDPHPGEVEVKRVYLLNRFQGNGLGKWNSPSTNREVFHAKQMVDGGEYDWASIYQTLRTNDEAYVEVYLTSFTGTKSAQLYRQAKRFAADRC